MATILLVDDTELVLKSTFRMLVRMGHVVITSSDGLLAKEILEGFRTFFDLIISDVNMPHMDGIQLFHWIATNKPDMVDKFMFYSGSTDLLNEDEAVKNVPRIDKPSGLVEFQKAVNDHL